LLKLNREDHELLESSGVGATYKQKLRDADDCVLKNAAFLKLLVAGADQMFEGIDDGKFLRTQTLRL
jgi:hypothetical protein